MVEALGEAPADAFVDELLPVLQPVLRESPSQAGRLIAALVRSGRRDAVGACVAVLLAPEEAFGPLGGQARAWFARAEAEGVGAEIRLADLRAQQPGVDDATLMRAALATGMAGGVMQQTAVELRRLGEQVGVPAPARGRREPSVLAAQWRQWSEQVAGQLRGGAGR